MTRINIDVDSRGPIFDGRAQAALMQYVGEVGHEVASRGEDMVTTELDHVLKHQTGHYRSSIRVVQRFGDDTITDGDIVYGPWLEGTGSRNQTTRFKGYSTFRRVMQRLDAQVPEIAEEFLRPYIRRMR